MWSTVIMVAKVDRMSSILDHLKVQGVNEFGKIQLNSVEPAVPD